MSVLYVPIYPFPKSALFASFGPFSIVILLAELLSMVSCIPVEAGVNVTAPVNAPIAIPSHTAASVRLSDTFSTVEFDISPVPNAPARPPTASIRPEIARFDTEQFSILLSALL